MVAYASLISRNWALPSPRRRASRKCLGNMWGGDEGVKEKSCELPFQDFGLGYADEILVTRQFLDEKQDRISVSFEGGTTAGHTLL